MTQPAKRRLDGWHEDTGVQGYRGTEMLQGGSYSLTGFISSASTL